MKLSTRSRYGFRAALELAINYGKGPLQVKAIAKKQEISTKYLEQLVAILKTSGLIRSVRGPKGGYMLSRHPSQIKLIEIFKTLEGQLITVECLEHPEYCPQCCECVTRQVWGQLQDAIFQVLDSQTLQDLVDKMLSGEDRATYQI